jgi:hypothetical protein
MKVSGRVACPTKSGRVRLWAGICVQRVSTFRSALVSVGVPERGLNTLADLRVAAVEASGLV